MTNSEKHTRMANAIRALAMDAVQAANSGHPGLPMGVADIATVLFTKFMKFDPVESKWADRDRFVLSAGHGSMLLYSLLYLLGYEDMTLDELKNFRQLGSKTAGHPEYGHASGIETTTGPLGQGIATAVGMAMAEKKLADEFGSKVVDHHIYVLVSDGDLMEGISHEAISLAGHLGLNKLIVLFDNNGISIDGPLSLSESGDQIKRFEAANWNTLSVDGHDEKAITEAIEAAQDSDKPTMIACKTTIGFGAPNKAGKSAAHGAPLGAEEIAGARKNLGWDYAPFEIPSDVLDAWRIAGLRSSQAHKEWNKRFAGLNSDLQSEFERRMRGTLPAGFGQAILDYKKELSNEPPTMSTRKSSEAALEVINDDFSGRFVHYGIREHGMAAAMNGMALHGGLIPYSGGFLIFSDYCRPSIRLAALMGLRVIHVLTHDSIGLGEDGPTHQPVEHLAALRAIPNLNVFRPCDAVETAECWQLALEQETTPSAIALTRQNLKPARFEFDSDNLCARGAYEVVIPEGESAGVTLFASGSEVEIAIAASELLNQAGHSTRVVSVPCFELFEAQSAEYKAATIGTSPVKIAVEAAIEMGWRRFIGDNGGFVGMTGFGASGPYKELYEHFGITAQAIVDLAKAKLSE